MPSLTFYFAPGACSLASHIALEEAGAPFEPKPISLRKGQQMTPEYLALNPKGKVPMLVVDGLPLTENPAIITYLASLYPDAQLLPAGNSVQALQGLSLISFCAAGIHPVLSRFFGPQRFCDLPDATPNVIALATAANAKNFAIIDKMLEGKEYMLGSFSAVDGYLLVFWRWCQHLKIDTTAFKNYAALAERVSARPAVQRALAREAEAQAALA
ncbi:glutathione S-transferase family protein [Ferrovibrio sp.]|uniref:glutathione S-transferase family protein n=1 Tax=Ferrovibrio sp. TaxID=1917215 RepID=UPI003D265F71